jgi:DNA repair protein RecO (recombination protein O)
LKSRKRFAGGVLDPLQYIEVSGSLSPAKASLANLDEAVLIEGFEGLRKDFDRLESAFWAADLINKIVVEDDPHNKQMFDLIGNGLKALASGALPEPFRIQFGLKVLQSQGVLEVETWMGPFLQPQLSAGVSASRAECEARLPWIEHQIRLYRERAEL